MRVLRLGMIFRLVNYPRMGSFDNSSVIERRLQRSLCFFTGGLLRLFFSAFQSLGHPFPHIWLVTQCEPAEQCAPSQTNQNRQRPTSTCPIGYPCSRLTEA